MKSQGDTKQVVRAVAISFALAIVGTVIGLVLTQVIARRRAVLTTA